MYYDKIIFVREDEADAFMDGFNYLGNEEHYCAMHYEELTVGGQWVVSIGKKEDYDE